MPRMAGSGQDGRGGGGIQGAAGNGQVTITYDPTTDRCSGLGEEPGGPGARPPAGVTPVPIAVAPAPIIGTPKFTG